jgi:hypothetical protein
MYRAPVTDEPGQHLDVFKAGHRTTLEGAAKEHRMCLRIWQKQHLGDSPVDYDNQRYGAV